MDFESIAGELTGVDEKGLSLVSSLCKQQIALEDRIKDLKADLKQSETDLRTLSTDTLPAAMQEYGVNKISMDDGSEITISEFVNVSIKVDDRERAYAWLSENGFGSLIKNHVTAQFGRNEDNLAKDFSAELQERGYISTSRTWVEPQTLKSWAKEQLGKGNNLPHDYMDIYNGNIAKIRRK
jgi:hypothetical protein|tara:strand:- start:841 stop:1386 length:546 start_codon:yes stop_codon:yes gene_type:complete